MTIVVAVLAVHVSECDGREVSLSMQSYCSYYEFGLFYVPVNRYGHVENVSE